MHLFHDSVNEEPNNGMGKPTQKMEQDKGIAEQFVDKKKQLMRKGLKSGITEQLPGRNLGYGFKSHRSMAGEIGYVPFIAAKWRFEDR
jgi:hypothetical protein